MCATNASTPVWHSFLSSGADFARNPVAANSMVANGTSIPELDHHIHSRRDEMVSLQDYQGREQSYVKHTFLERYLEALVHKTASTYPHVVYVDGFAGPWQSTNEKFQDTSFGIAL